MKALISSLSTFERTKTLWPKHAHQDRRAAVVMNRVMHSMALAASKLEEGCVGLINGHLFIRQAE